jgi:hypothetical protein
MTNSTIHWCGEEDFLTAQLFNIHFKLHNFSIKKEL